jgi:parallel beta-helix repeat protein
MTMARSVRLAGKDYPVVLPTRRDPRLHLAAVIISIHIIGVSALGFDVSIPQILSAIVVCGVIEFGVTLARTRTLVWPASALLTGSGIALILRVVGTPPDLWSWHGWYYFALVGVGALLSKYLIHYRGTHVFNPSNLALVVAFLWLGRGVIEPLDFWWAPLNGWMIAAYTIILVGGLVITSRLGLLPMAAAFWVTLAVGLAVLAASGHCFTARWALEPVCGQQFWWIIVTSPELLIFLFFMITDPKTIPAGRAARVVFAITLGIVATLLIAPQSTEFGAKVALLGGLVLLTPTRWLFDHAIPRVAERTRLAEFLTAVTTAGGIDIGIPRTVLRGGIGGIAAALLGVAVVAAGTPARQPPVGPVAAPVPIEVTVDAAALPTPTVDDEVASINSGLDFTEEAKSMTVALAENLAVEAEAIAQGDERLLDAVDSGSRLVGMRKLVEEAVAAGSSVVATYDFATLHLRPEAAPGGQGSDLAFDATGEVQVTEYDGEDAVRTASAPFASTFVLRRVGDRWVLVDVIDAPDTDTILADGPAKAPRVLAVPGEYTTIAAAVAAAGEGAVVEVGPGRYTESISITKPIVLRGPGDGAAQVVGDGEAAVISISDTSGVTIQGLAVTKGRVGILVERSDGVVITGNLITDNELRGIHVINGSADIRGNEVRDTSAPFGIGIHVANASGWPQSVIEDNVVEGNGKAGITTNFARVVIRGNSVQGNGGNGISVTEMSVASVIANQVHDNQGTEVLVIDGSNAAVEGNTIAASPLLETGNPIPLLVEFNATADVVDNVMGPRGWCAVSLGIGASITGSGNQWDGDAGACDPVPTGLFVAGG